MARCITYFTMLVDILIIKNAKAVSVILLTGNSSLTDDVFYTSFIFSTSVVMLYLESNEACICVEAAETEALSLVHVHFNRVTC